MSVTLTESERLELQIAMRQSTSGSVTGMLLTRAVEQIAVRRMADAWDEGAEATAEWSASYMHGDNGPPDPPRNPYEVTK